MWGILFILTCAFNGYLLGSHGYHIDNWEFWAWTFCTIFAFWCGSRLRAPIIKRSDDDGQTKDLR